MIKFTDLSDSFESTLLSFLWLYKIFSLCFQVFSESRIVEYSIKEEVISPGKKEVQNSAFLPTLHIICLTRLHAKNLTFYLIDLDTC